MSSLNEVRLIGNLGADPEIRSFQNGGRVANLSVATSRKWRDKHTGEVQERTEWHRVTVVSDGLVGICEKYLRKGGKVAICGSLETRKWQDQSGADRYTTEIRVGGFDGKLILLGDPREGGVARPAAPGGASGPTDLDDEIPF